MKQQCTNIDEFKKLHGNMLKTPKENLFPPLFQPNTNKCFYIFSTFSTCFSLSSHRLSGMHAYYTLI